MTIGALLAKNKIPDKDCIYEGGRTLYIQPDECIDGGLCETVCPVAAIHADDRLPTSSSPGSRSTANSSAPR